MPAKVSGSYASAFFSRVLVNWELRNAKPRVRAVPICSSVSRLASLGSLSVGIGLSSASSACGPDGLDVEVLGAGAGGGACATCTGCGCGSVAGAVVAFSANHSDPLGCGLLTAGLGGGA